MRLVWAPEVCGYCGVDFGRGFRHNSISFSDLFAVYAGKLMTVFDRSLPDSTEFLLAKNPLTP